MNVDSILTTKPLQYIAFLLMFIFAQATSMWGQYFTLKYPNMTMIQAFLAAIPFAWIDWGFMSVAVYLGDRYKLVTPTQDTLLLIIVQFVSILVINSLWLKQSVSKSDIACFFIILAGFYISFSNALSKLLGYPVPKKDDSKKSDDKKSDDKKVRFADGVDCGHNASGQYHCLTGDHASDAKNPSLCGEKGHHRNSKIYHCFDFPDLNKSN